ncbi:MAG: NAD/NADP octopine/nopaline dehydrogenase family protein [Bacilli bacterium]|jgi:hypothetical protein|nr:NAD/NADP octopine/nopaline dehydrogenase family protein [Bacilli bacterium]
MKIAIVGGGNIGTAIACYTADKHDVYIYSSQPNVWKKNIIYRDKVSGIVSISSDIKKISDDYSIIISDADIIFITHPSFMIETTINNIVPYLKKGCLVGIIPGTGGAEFYANKVLAKNAVFFGLDRVPCVSRIEKYGEEIIASKKEKTRLATIPRSYSKKVSEIISKVLDIDIEALDNYLVVTFTPSNPLVHSSRLYSMLKDNEELNTWDYNPLFYGEWDDVASEIMIACDNELHQICDSLDKLNMNQVISLKEHYEVNDINEMTNKIKSIDTMKHILSPMINLNGKFIIDKNSRYFTEDIPYGLCIIKDFARICKIDTPYIDKVLKCFEVFMNKEYFIDNIFQGIDLKDTSIPSNYSLIDKNSIFDFYLQ